MSIISTKNIKYKFVNRNENNEVIGENIVLDNINIDIEQGEFVAILGHNGSGKSTFARHLNALLFPYEGSIFIDGKDTKIQEELWSIREKCGMVFQNPDNQIVGVTVEEDVGFGPENLGINSKEICDRVDNALKKVDMIKCAGKSPSHLSGGQKQRVAIASALAMKPLCIVLDEPTAMLDPQGRKDVIDIIGQLNRDENITIILITHNMEEAVMANRVIVLDGGKVILDGKPREVFSDVENMKAIKLDVPQVTELAYELYKMNRISKYDVLTVDEFVKQFDTDNRAYLSNLLQDNITDLENSKYDKTNLAELSMEKTDKNVLLSIEDVSLIYEQGNAMETIALSNINLNIYENELIGIIGHTGSGKSSLIQVMNGLIQPTTGRVLYKAADIWKKGFNRRNLHCEIGIVFQYPESQLFEETVLKDVMFGPLNKGYSEEEAKNKSIEALTAMKLDEKYYDKSPFELSGGEKRRVAIAGILAMNPEIIILDEPTAGLDPMAKSNLLKTLKQIRQNSNKTVIIVSHNMEDMADYVDRLLVVNSGRIVYDDLKRNVFQHCRELIEIGLGVPQVTYIMQRLKKMGYGVDDKAITIEEALKSIGEIV